MLLWKYSYIQQSHISPWYKRKIYVDLMMQVISVYGTLCESIQKLCNIYAQPIMHYWIYRISHLPIEKQLNIIKNNICVEKDMQERFDFLSYANIL